MSIGAIVHAWLESSMAARMGWVLLHFVWEGAALAMVLSVALWGLRRRTPQLRYGVAVGALCVLAVLPAATFVWVGGEQRVDSSKAGDQVDAIASAIFEKTIVAGADRSAPQSAVRETRATPAEVRPPVGPMEWHAPSETAHRHWVDAAAASMPWLVPAWMAGVLVLSVWNLVAYAGVGRLKRKMTAAAPVELRARVARLAERMGIRRAVAVLQTPLADSPLVIGFFKPVILLPVSVLTGMPPAQIEALLAHELAHIRRHDYLVNLFQTAIETLLFYHPAVWWVSRRIRLEREQCCDDVAVEMTADRRTYVRALATVANIRTPALAAAASGGGVLLPRLKRLAGVPDADAGTGARWLAGVAVLIALVAVGVMVIPSVKARAADAAASPYHPYGYTDPAHAYPQPDRSNAGECELAGQVVDDQGKPVAGATVFFGNRYLQPQSPRVKPSVTTDANGRFSFKPNYAGRTDVFAYARGSAGWVRDLDSDAKNLVVQIEPAANELNFAGKVLDTDGKSPVADARVLLLDAENSVHMLGETRTDTTGHYRFNYPLKNRSYAPYLRIVALPVNRAMAWCTVPYVSASDIDLQLKAPTTLTGRVVNSQGAGVMDATFAFMSGVDPQYGELECYSMDKAILMVARTDKDGWFVINALPQGGRHSLIVTHPDYADVQLQNLSTLQIEQEIPDVRLADGASVEGTVVTPDGKAAAGITVTIGYPISPPRSTLTNAGGHYRIGGLQDDSPGSQIEVVAQSAGEVPQWKATAYQERGISADDHLTMNLTLQRSTAAKYAEWKEKPGKMAASRYAVAILDDVDPSFSGKASYDDTLTIRDSTGKALWEKGGFNIAQDIGGSHAIAADFERRTLWVCESVGRRLLNYGVDGKLNFEKPDIRAMSIALDPKTGNLWASCGNGTIYGGNILVFNPQGEQISKWDIQANNLAYSAHDDCFWAVGKGLQKIDRQGRIVLTGNFEAPWVATSAAVNDVDGSVWITEGRHPNVKESRGRVWIFDSGGNLRRNFEVDFDNRCVVVDTARRVAWIGTPTRVVKTDLDGKVLAEAPVAASAIAIEPDTGYVWCASWNSGLFRIDADAKLIWTDGAANLTQKWVAIVPR